MKVTFEARVLMTFDGTEVGDNVITDTSDLAMALIPDENLVLEDYVSDKDHITAEGTEIMTDMFVESLIALMSYSNDKGYCKDYEYLKDVISRLEAGLMTPTEVLERKNALE